MPAVGPSYGPILPVGETTRNFAITIGSADVLASSAFNGGQFSKVTVGSAGTLYLQGSDDAAMVPFTVIAGQIIRGLFQAVGGSTTGSTAALKLVISC